MILFSRFIPGDPRTKKNSQRVIKRGNKWYVIPSAAFEQYQNDCLWHLKRRPISKPIDQKVNVKCVYHMATKRKVDLTNLLESTDDILQAAGVIADDESNIVAGHDGSRVIFGGIPGVEITISEYENNNQWISCDQQLPRPGYYICATLIDDIAYYGIAEWNGKNWIEMTASGKEDIIDVNFWTWIPRLEVVT